MTLEQIDYFICAAQSRTFFDAAEAMHISQSSLSKQIMKLEKELELTLWDRSKRTAVLTPEGEFFYKEALKISRQYHRSLEAVYHFKDSKLQALHIGTLPFLSQYHLTSVIHSFCDTHPELSFSLKEVEDEELLSGLEKDLFNLIFVRKHMIDPELYTFHALTADRLVAVFPEAHPSASKKSVSLSELKKESFILILRTPPFTVSVCKVFIMQGSTLSFCVLPVQNLLSAQWKLAKGSVFLPKAAFSSFVSLRLLLSRLTDWKSYLLELPIKKIWLSQPLQNVFCSL